MKIWSYSQSHRIDGDGELVKKANRYFEAGEVHGLSPDTVRSYAFTLMAFFIWIKSDWNAFENLDKKKLQDWLTHLKGIGLKPRSINQMLVCVRAFYRFQFGKGFRMRPAFFIQKRTIAAQGVMNEETPTGEGEIF